MKHDKRQESIERTRKTADNHRQLWSAWEDECVLAKAYTVTSVGDNKPLSVPMSDEDLALNLGRTTVAVSQRRVVLNKLLQQGMSLEEIHEVERWNRAQRNSIRARVVVDLLRATCEECFCNPHIPGCSKEAS